MAKQKTTYVDGFILVVPKKNVAKYRKMARQGAQVWMKHGALSYRECMLDDATPPFITRTFPKLTKVTDDDTVWFSYIEFESKKHRNQVNKKVMKEMQEQYSDQDSTGHMKDMPFDMKRMSYGGFKVVVSN